MAIFKTLKIFLRLIGFLEYDRPYAYLIAIGLRSAVITGIVLKFSSTTAYLFFEKSAPLHKKILCLASMLSMTYVALTTFTFLTKKDRFFGVIKDLEAQIAVRERKYGRTVYKEANVAFEVYTAKMIISLNGILAFGVAILPVTLVSYYNYYVNDLGEDSFIVSVPAK